MIDGLFAAAAGMEAQQTQLDAVANDLANVSTPGYQSEELGFHDLLYTTSGPGNGTTQATGAGAAAEIVGRSQAAGQLVQTGRSLDVALQGEGYLEVRRPDGTIGLTRNGALELDASRRLTTQTGMLLEPPITIPSGVPLDKLAIAPDGSVQVAGRTIGQLSVVTVPAPDRLLSAGDSTFQVTAASGPLRKATGTTVEQGFLEQSNVDVATAMGQMIDAQRGYQMDSRAIQMQDQMMQIANQIGPR
ncbi:MAG TPA: flagellar hook-basal body protein [Solirubrobacteraceae bacterium]|nr:flagellar hook-basal body protein [Solirubrobacteraceae bacterium]